MPQGFERVDLSTLDQHRHEDDVRARRFPELEAEQQRRMELTERARAYARQVQDEIDARSLNAKLDQFSDRELAALGLPPRQVVSEAGGIVSEETVGTPGAR